jgi:hypothetical protein
MSLVFAVLLALTSAVAYAAGAVVQQRLAGSAGRGRRNWLPAVALNGGGAALHVLDIPPAQGRRSYGVQPGESLPLRPSEESHGPARRKPWPSAGRLRARRAGEELLQHPRTAPTLNA